MPIDFLALKYSSKEGTENYIKHALDTGKIDVKYTDSRGYTALLWLVRSGVNNLSKRLVQEGADVNHMTWYSNVTPLYYSVSSRNTEMAKYLLNHGADPNLGVSTQREIQPLLLAVIKGYTDIALPLLQAGAKRAYKVHQGFVFVILHAIKYNCVSSIPLLCLFGEKIKPSDVNLSTTSDMKDTLQKMMKVQGSLRFFCISVIYRHNIPHDHIPKALTDI